MRIALALLILLGSLSVSASEFDDTKALAAVTDKVYYCSTTTHLMIERGDVVARYESQTFKFRQNDEQLDFGHTSRLLIDSTLPWKVTLLSSQGLGVNDWFRAETTYSRIEYDNGVFLFSTIHPRGVRSFVATCESFD